MKIEAVVKQFQESGHHLLCPVCHSRLSLLESGSFVCAKQHCFDLSAKGYVNFIPNQNQDKLKYGKELFDSRNAIFEDGFYAPVLDAITKIVQNNTPAVLLDAGCGDGYYISRLQKTVPDSDYYAIDNNRQAIQLAAQKNRKVKWMVADLANLPMEGGGTDCLLNILTPANYEEFMRVLSPRGVVVKVVPGMDYLKEIRACLGSQIRRQEYSNQKVVDYFCQSTRLLERKKVHYELPVSPEQFQAFLRMTPMTFGVDLQTLKGAQATQITIDLEILTGTHP